MPASCRKAKTLPLSPTPSPLWHCLSPRTEKNWRALVALASSHGPLVSGSCSLPSAPVKTPTLTTWSAPVPYAWTRCAAGRPLGPRRSFSSPADQTLWGKCVSFWMRWRARPSPASTPPRPLALVHSYVSSLVVHTTVSGLDHAATRAFLERVGDDVPPPGRSVESAAPAALLKAYWVGIAAAANQIRNSQPADSAC